MLPGATARLVVVVVVVGGTRETNAVNTFDAAGLKIVSKKYLRRRRRDRGPNGPCVTIILCHRAPRGTGVNFKLARNRATYSG